ncbi:porin [Anaplasma phagocytophilum]|uniref:porin n=1 Tax=Anaplasma phagocytophilum TaxID=948 RepID=UPI00200C7F72|nr:porin [Anaplasma phagocytophilum]UQD53968.1 porin [Anaplasma phagocytophilum]
MTRVSLSTTLASLMMFYGMSDALASSATQQSRVLSDEKGVVAVKRVTDKSNLGRYITVSPVIDIGGSVLSHGWFAFRDSYYHKKGIEEKLFPASENLRVQGFASDAMLYVTAEGKNNNYKIRYGGSIELEVPYTQKADYTSFKQVSNRGTKVYVNTTFGEVSFGYQVGIDSIMRVDALSIGAGDISNTWMRYVNLRGIHDPLEGLTDEKRLVFVDASTEDIEEGRASWQYGNQVIPVLQRRRPALPIELKKLYLENVFYLSTGLYSESLFDGGNRFSRNASKPIDANNAPNLTNALPLRFTYLSPDFAGLRLGVSYAPFGYEEDLVLDAHTAIKRSLVARMRVFKNYKRFHSAIRDKFSIPLVEEGGTRKKFIIPLYENIVNAGMTYSSSFNDLDFKLSVVTEYAKGKTRLLRDSTDIEFAKMDTIKNIVLGGMLKYKNVKLAASYGYLGQIDNINNMYSYRLGEFVLKTADRVIIRTSGSYFLTAGAGYEYDRLYVSAFYRGSNYSGNIFNEVSLGAEYNISGHSSRVKSMIFANYHNFSALSAVVTDPVATDGVNRGQVILAGMKVRF